jgi:hypothetical protein
VDKFCVDIVQCGFEEPDLCGFVPSDSWSLETTANGKGEIRMVSEVGWGRRVRVGGIGAFYKTMRWHQWALIFLQVLMID